jgi:hypothetical protein
MVWETPIGRCSPLAPLLATCSTCRHRCQVVLWQQFYKIYYLEDRRGEIRNPKQIQMSKAQNSKRFEQRLIVTLFMKSSMGCLESFLLNVLFYTYYGFEHLVIRISPLFRI